DHQIFRGAGGLRVGRTRQRARQAGGSERTQTEKVSTGQIAGETNGIGSHVVPPLKRRGSIYFAVPPRSSDAASSRERPSCWRGLAPRRWRRAPGPARTARDSTRRVHARAAGDGAPWTGSHWSRNEDPRPVRERGPRPAVAGPTPTA